MKRKPTAPKVRKRQLNMDERKLAVSMCDELTPEQVAEYMDVHPSTVRRMRKLYVETGEVLPSPKPDVLRGRKRALSEEDVKVCHGLRRLVNLARVDAMQVLVAIVERESGLTLPELRVKLRRERGVDVTQSTITRTLKRCGFMHVPVEQ